MFCAKLSLSNILLYNQLKAILKNLYLKVYINQPYQLW